MNVRHCIFQPPGVVTPSAGLVSSPAGLGGQADMSVIGGPGLVIPQTLGQSSAMITIPPPGIVTAGLATPKTLPGEYNDLS